jgi:hypothetical protein
MQQCPASASAPFCHLQVPYAYINFEAMTEFSECSSIFLKLPDFLAEHQ